MQGGPELKRCSCRLTGVVRGLLLPMDLWPSQLHPVGFSGFPRQEVNGGLACPCATFVATMVLVKHEQLESLLGDVPFATRQRRADQGIDHLHQRGSADNGIEWRTSPRVERDKCLGEEPFGASQPVIAFVLMVMLLLGLSWRAHMIMVPRQHKKISRLPRHNGKQWCIHRFGLRKRNHHIVNMRLHRLARFASSRAVDLSQHRHKARQLRVDSLSSTQFSLW